MIRSLITQLSLQCTSTPRAIELLFSSYMDGDRQPTSDTLLATLLQTIRGFDELFIILDALDECENREELLEDVKVITSCKPGKLHILVISRREKDIEESLNSLVDDQKKVCIQSALVNDDIRAYI